MEGEDMKKEKKVINLRNKIIGGPKPQVCVPLVGNTKEQLIMEAKEILTFKPDLVEWRVDYFKDVEEIEKVKGLLKQLRNILKDYPIIFTCRTKIEGGYKKIDDEIRLNLTKEIIKTKQVEIVDIELIYGEETIKEIIDIAKENGIYIIISSHDFEATPSKETIVERLLKAEVLGADISKIAVMPNTMRDVLTLLEATLEAYEKAQVPIVTMSMSNKGIVSRTTGSLFGSAITFASGKSSSAPGQIPISELRMIIDTLLKY
jgi:3-dehydroquinate dehydratase-1